MTFEIFDQSDEKCDKLSGVLYAPQDALGGLANDRGSYDDRKCDKFFADIAYKRTLLSKKL